MTHVSEDDLIALALGDAEPGSAGATSAHVESCAECRAALAEIEATLEAAASMPVPVRGDDYGRKVWASIEPALGTRHSVPSTGRGTRHPAPGTMRPWIALAAALLLAAGAYWLGRQSVNPAPQQAHAPAPAPDAPAASTIRERVMLAALGEHLDRTERTLVELVNTAPEARVDISAEQQWARDLLEANRLYRRAAGISTTPALSQVLDDLEPVLLEIANSPSRITSEEFEALRDRIEARSLLFKVRVSGADVRARERALTPRRTAAVPSA
jgi:anti-sigma factor RsiW